MQVVVGRIRRPHGVRGEVSVEVRTDDPDRRFTVGGTLSTDPADRGPLTLRAARWHSGSLLLTFAEIPDRTAAEELRGTWLVVDSADLGPTGDPDEFYDHELIGLTAVTTAGEVVGPVTDVRHYGQDLLVIESAADDELLVPFVAAIVPEVDVAGGRLVIDPPPGLLEP
jgi:16S rRNA processing protein RimM